MVPARAVSDGRETTSPRNRLTRHREPIAEENLVIKFRKTKCYSRGPNEGTKSGTHRRTAAVSYPLGRRWRLHPPPVPASSLAEAARGPEDIDRRHEYPLLPPDTQG